MANELHTLNLNGTNYPIRPYSFQIAENTVTTTENDIPNNWGGLGCTVHFYKTTSQLKDQPCSGYLINFSNFINPNETSSASYQFLMNQLNGDIYRRSGLGTSWNTTSWKKIINEDDLSNELSTKQDKFKINDNDINANDNLQLAIIDPGDVGTYVVASGLNDATIGDTYYALPTNPDNFEDERVLATKSDVNSKQDNLVSGTNIKTINNESVIGSGNINTGVKIITLSSLLTSAGGTFTTEEQSIIFDNTIGTIIFNSSNGVNTWVMTRSRTNAVNLPTNMPRVYLTGLRCVSENYKYFVNLYVFSNGTYTYTETKIATPTPVVTGTVETSQITLQPNTYVKVKDYPAGQGLLVKLATPKDNTILNEYTLEINWTSGSTQILAGSIAFESSDIMWLNNETPTFTTGRTYRISIINNCAKSECFYQTLVVG